MSASVSASSLKGAGDSSRKKIGKEKEIVSVEADFLGRTVWIPDTTEGFVLANILDIGGDSVTAQKLRSSHGSVRGPI